MTVVAPVAALGKRSDPPISLPWASAPIPDITAAQLQTERARKLFLRDIQSRIQFFEPRLGNVRVRLLPNADYQDRTLRFQIDATLLAGPASEPIVFDSQLDPAAGNISIQGGLR